MYLKSSETYKNVNHLVRTVLRETFPLRDVNKVSLKQNINSTIRMCVCGCARARVEEINILSSNAYMLRVFCFFINVFHAGKISYCHRLVKKQSNTHTHPSEHDILRSTI